MRRLDADREVDIAIVGAGYTGLACAQRLAALRPQWSIVIVDALRVGQGSAGRNSGFAVDTGHYVPGLGADGNGALVKLARHGIERLRERVHSHAIACDWHEGGRYHVAVNRRGHAALEAFVAGLEAMGEGYRRVEPESLAAVLGTEYYTRAVHVPGGALVQPAALVRGLAGALPETVTCCEASPVRRIEPGSPFVLSTEHARVRAKRVVMTVNGYARGWGIASGRVIPLLTFASVTEPLDDPPGEGEGAAGQWGAVPEERLGSTMRRTADGRILVRNGVVYRRRPGLGAPDLKRMAAMHSATLASRFPELAERGLDTTWGGVLGMTINGGLSFGAMGDRAWACVGFNGVGMALGTALGDLLAHEIAGESHDLLEHARALPTPGWLPPAALLPVGLGAYTSILQTLAGRER